MKILATGASGNVGTYVIKELLNMNEKIVAAGTNINRLKDIYDNTLDIVKFDFTKKKHLKILLME